MLRRAIPSRRRQPSYGQIFIDLLNFLLYGCLLSVVYPNEESPDGLHTGMFLPALYGQASAEQTHWADRAERYDFLGTYAQTELGHGNLYTPGNTK